MTNPKTIPESIPEFWAIIPAAGVGKRMQADRPKQYLSLGEKTVIENTLDRLLGLPEIKGAVLSISATDEYWPDLKYASRKPLLVANGGLERSDSVLNALLHLETQVERTENTWVLVHDAARPCVRAEDVQVLISTAVESPHGGLLAVPVKDTMKRGDEHGSICKTVDRQQLWHALTPQMFRLDLLLAALQNAQHKQLSITDDASAMELQGYQPKLVEAHDDNIKITRAFDLQLAELFLQSQTDE